MFWSSCIICEKISSTDFCCLAHAASRQAPWVSARPLALSFFSDQRVEANKVSRLHSFLCLLLLQNLFLLLHLDQCFTKRVLGNPPL